MCSLAFDILGFTLIECLSIEKIFNLFRYRRKIEVLRVATPHFLIALLHTFKEASKPLDFLSVNESKRRD